MVHALLWNGKHVTRLVARWWQAVRVDALGMITQVVDCIGLDVAPRGRAFAVRVRAAMEHGPVGAVVVAQPFPVPVARQCLVRRAYGARDCRRRHRHLAPSGRWQRRGARFITRSSGSVKRVGAHGGWPRRPFPRRQRQCRVFSVRRSDVHHHRHVPVDAMLYASADAE
eukprot:365011-Chlamydomonas_euryale.AAC.26